MATDWSGGSNMSGIQNRTVPPWIGPRPRTSRGDRRGDDAQRRWPPGRRLGRPARGVGPVAEDAQGRSGHRPGQARLPAAGSERPGRLCDVAHDRRSAGRRRRGGRGGRSTPSPGGQPAWRSGRGCAARRSCRRGPRPSPDHHARLGPGSTGPVDLAGGPIIGRPDPAGRSASRRRSPRRRRSRRRSGCRSGPAGWPARPAAPRRPARRPAGCPGNPSPPIRWV